MHTSITTGRPQVPGPAPVLSIRNLSRRFGGVQALSDVSLEIRPSEIHGLLGENGSGKSTLIKILAGYYAPDPGAELAINGSQVELPIPAGGSHDLGLSFVHQQLGLLPDLSVLENLRIGTLARGRSLRRVAWGHERRAAREVFDRYALDVDPDSEVRLLSQTDRARLAIVRAVVEMRETMAGGEHKRGLLVLDEPTVFLPREGIDQLFALVRDVVEHDASVLFVSHDLDEIRTITDRVTVLRDGRVHGTADTAKTSDRELVQLIVGHELQEFEAGQHELGDAPLALEVSGLSGAGVDAASFNAARGEILGLTGLLGSGFDALPYLLFGVRRADTGELCCNGEQVDLTAMTPERALDMGMVLLPGDRQRLGSIGELTVAENVTLPVLDEHCAGPRLLRRSLDAVSRRLLTEYDVRPAEPRVTYNSLSGGNQQKALLAKWLQMNPEIVLLHEPTQGVDIGARQQIFARLEQASRDGATVICASSDYDQLARICDRVLVFGRGRITCELSRSGVTKERITEQVYSSVTLDETKPGEM
jgi:ribose transport system ATP-binding protein